MSRWRLGVLMGLCFCVTSCTTVGPDFVLPDAPVLENWSSSEDSTLSPTHLELTKWWEVFEDPTLNLFVEAALVQNIPLEISALRVLESRAQLGIATGRRFPQTQVVTGDATFVSPPNSSRLNDTFWDYSLGASAAWEVDFWGRYRRGIESADAALLASLAAYDQAAVLLVAQVVDTYTAIREAEEQLRIAQENLELQQRSYDIAEVLFRNGADSELDMMQANTLLLSTKASVPALETTLKRAHNAMSSLLGRVPGETYDMLSEPAGIPVAPDEAAMGMPADMLRRRPDLRQAEMLAMSQNALVGFAAADLFPTFSLFGSISLTAGGPGDSDFGDLFDGDAFSFAAGPSFVWPFWNYGRIRNNIRVQDVRLQQALLNYRDVAIRAAREVEDAIASFLGARTQDGILEETVASAIRSNEISTLRYREGFSDYQRVLDAQQSLFAQQQRLATNQANIARSFVSLYKALGAGWEHREGEPRIAPETLDTMRERTKWGNLLDDGKSAIDTIEEP